MKKLGTFKPTYGSTDEILLTRRIKNNGGLCTKLYQVIFVILMSITVLATFFIMETPSGIERPIIEVT